MIRLSDMAKPRIVPVLDEGFRPAALADRAYLEAVRASGQELPLVIGLERGDGCVSVYKTQVTSAPELKEATLQYAERLVKFLLWARGGWKVYVGGPKEIGEHIKATYSPTGARAFDYDFMGQTVCERDFEVAIVKPEEVPASRESAQAIGRHLEGNRIGIDLGASDFKISAVVDGKAIFSDEIVWFPKDNTDPEYHYEQIRKGLKIAASHLPKVDAIGVSSAGIWINNRSMMASLFRGIPRDLYNARIKDIFLNIQKEWGVPLEVANDGDVTALMAAMGIGEGEILGIALGSSEAVGYVDNDMSVKGWLNELAFAPIDYRPDGPVDEWSGDEGCGVQYMSQQAVGRLLPAAGIELPEEMDLPNRLKEVQKLMAANDPRARKIYETIGVYVGYAVAHYASFYQIRHALILGRVTSGEGGNIIVEKAHEVIKTEFPGLSAIKINLPDEKARRVGQSVAAASLPAIG